MDYIIGFAWFVATRTAIAFGCMAGAATLIFLASLALEVTK